MSPHDPHRDWLRDVRDHLAAALDALDAHEELTIAARLAEIVELVDNRLTDRDE